MVDAKEKVYLDFNATTPLDPKVIDSITAALVSAWANPSSSSELGTKAKQVVNDSRRKTAEMIGAAENDLLFVSGGTEANNLVIWTSLEYFNTWQKNSGSNLNKPHVITTNVEHDAVLLPLKMHESKQQTEVDYVPVSVSTCRVDCREVLKAIRPNTCLISIMLANNETGIIMPVASLASSLKEINKKREQEGLCQILFHTDAAQAIGKIPVNVSELGVDYLTIVGHKFYGPRIGALYVRNLGSGAPLYPMFFGGGQERSYRPGTENTPMIAGLGTASELVTRSLKGFSEHMLEMRNLLEQLLEQALGDKVKFNCRTSERLPNTCNVSFPFSGLTGGQILSLCPNLLASTGAACHGTGKPSSILMASGVSFDDAKSSVRLSVGRHTTAEQVERVVEMITTALS